MSIKERLTIKIERATEQRNYLANKLQELAKEIRTNSFDATELTPATYLTDRERKAYGRLAYHLHEYNTILDEIVEIDENLTMWEKDLDDPDLD